jgi:hypothetical protein
VIPFIQALYKRYLNRPGSTTEWADWADRATEGRWTFKGLEDQFTASRAEGGTVTAAYREILGRDPESVEVIRHWSDTETIAEVWFGIADSAEGRARAGR